MIAFVHPLLLSLFWLTAAGGQAAAQSQGSARAAKPAPRQTLIRVVDEAGKAVPAARVFVQRGPTLELMSSPGAGPLDYPGSALREYRCDERGRVRVPFEGQRPIWLWSVQTKAGQRRASKAVSIVAPSRPQRLTLLPFPVSKIRVVGLAAWRDALPAGTKFRVAFVSDAWPHVRFAVDLPEPVAPAKATKVRGPIVELPALPWGNYYPALLDAEGLVDVRYFSPAFHESDAPEDLYERDVPLKRFVLGEPTEVACLLESHGKLGVQHGVPGLHASLRSSYSGLGLERRLRSNEQGVVQMLLPKRGPEARGWQQMSLHVCTPGYRPARIPFAQFPKRREKLILEEGRPSHWSFKGLRASDRFFLFCRPLPMGPEETACYELRRRDKGLELPALDGPMAQRNQILLLRDGALLPLYGGMLLPQACDLDLDKDFYTLDFLVKRRKGRLRSGSLDLCLRAGGTVQLSISYLLDREGRCQMRLPRGDWYVYAAHPRYGASFKLIKLRKSMLQEIVLDDYAVLHGAVLRPDRTPVGRASLGVFAEFRSIEAAMLNRWVTAIPQSWQADSQGQFRLLLPAFVPRWQIHASFAEEGQSYLTGGLQVQTRDAAEAIEIMISG